MVRKLEDKLEDKICMDVWNECEKSLRNICNLKLWEHPTEIDDVMSEVFIILYKRVSSGDLPNDLKAWVYGTLSNKIGLKFREINRTRDKFVYMDDDFEIPLGSNNVEERMEEVYSEEVKKQLKSLLSEDEYRIVEYFYYDRLKMKEIAQKLGSTEAAIKQRNYRICRKLRKILKNPENIF